MKIQKNIQFISIALIAVQILYIALTYHSIPNTIPIRFNATGEADDFGKKFVIWFIPFIEIIIFMVIQLAMTRQADGFKMNWPVNEANKEAVHRFTKVWSAMVILPVILLFTYIIVGVINVAQGNQQSLNPTGFVIFILVNLVVVFGGIFMLQEVNSGRRKC